MDDTGVGAGARTGGAGAELSVANTRPKENPAAFGVDGVHGVWLFIAASTSTSSGTGRVTAGVGSEFPFLSLPTLVVVVTATS